MTSPAQFLRRTPLRRLFENNGAAWRGIGDAAVAETAGAQAERGGLVIADFSPLPRLGFKGRGTIDAMKKRGIVVEPEPNRAFRQPNGGLCLVLAPGEVILLSNLAGDGRWLDDLASGWSIDDAERTYPLPRRDSHAWFAIRGAQASAMFAKLCAVDLRADRFADLSIAQTSIAKMSAIVVRADQDGDILYHVLADSAAALYFCDCLTDAAREFSGRLAGISAFDGAIQGAN